MPITKIDSDPTALTLTAIGDYAVSVERLWRAWTDPRQLERFWGPPEWPATFTRHDARVGGASVYSRTGPTGKRSRGYWRFDLVEPNRRFAIRDGFAKEDGTPDEAFPEIRMNVVFEATEGGSRFVAISTFPSVEAMERLIAMGMLEGLTAALGQLEGVIAELRASSADPAALEVIDDTHAVIRREVRGTLAQVWRAHHEPALLQRWLLGPDGWTMPVCDVAAEVGDTYRYEWESEADGTRFGFEGVLLESESPRRALTTERMIGTDGPSTRNELVLSPRPGGRTRVEVRIEYPSKELRDMILGTGMVDGMEASFARLERVLDQPTG